MVSKHPHESGVFHGARGVYHHTLETGDLQTAVAIALSWDAATPTWAVDSRSVQRSKWMESSQRHKCPLPLSGRARTHWDDTDEALLQVAIEAWRPGGLLVEEKTGERDLARLMALMGRFVQHPEVVPAFERAGVDVGMFSLWQVSDTTPDHLLKNEMWFPQSALHAPLFVAAANQYNLVHAVGLMSRAEDRSAANAAREVIDAITEKGESNGFASSILVDMATESPFAGAPSGGDGGPTEVLDFLSQLQRLFPSLMAQGAQMRVLNKVMNSDTDRDSRTGFITRALSLQGHPEALPLREAICAWQVLSAQPLNPHRSQSSWRSSVISSLLISALKTHAVEVLNASRSLLAEAAVTGSMFSGEITRIGVLTRPAPWMQTGDWMRQTSSAR